MKSEKINHGYHGILTMTLTCAIALVLDEIFQLRIPLLIAILCSVVTAIGIFCFDMAKKNMIRYVVVSSIIPILLLCFWIKNINVIKWIKGLIRWWMTYYGSEELYHKAYAYTSIILITIFSFIVLYITVKHLLSRNVLAVILIITMIILAINEINVSKIVVGVVNFYMLTVLVETGDFIKRRRLDITEKSPGILYLTPICLLLAVVSVGLPSKDEPIQWEGVKKVYQNVKDQIITWTIDFEFQFAEGEDEFSLPMSGYSEGKEDINKGTIEVDEKVALLVQDDKSKHPVYLIGYVNDIYNDNTWDKSNEIDDLGEDEYYLDYLELAYGLARQSTDSLENNHYLNKRKLMIRYNHIRTKTFFYPIKSSLLIESTGKRGMDQGSVNITYDKKVGKGTESSIQFYEMNLEGEAFAQMLQAAESFTYADGLEVDQKDVVWVLENVMDYNSIIRYTNEIDWLDLLTRRAQRIRSHYIQLPPELPDRVKELALDITKDCNTSYDKLKAIEQYLHSYTYTLYPGKFPEDRDFIDYFLFDRQEGYCTAFASAMAILGRCVEIPTRYVSGYVVNFNEKDDNNFYQVRNSNAHAWAEGYIEGIGWLPFEPTPGYEVSRYRAWADPKKVENIQIANHNIPAIPVIETPAIMDENSTVSNELGLYIRIGVSFLGIIIGASIFLYLLFDNRYKGVLLKADYSEKTYIIFLHILYYLKRKGYSMEQQETVLMFANRINNKFDTPNLYFKNIISIFMNYRYGNEAILKDEFDQVNGFLQELRQIDRREHNKLEVWFHHFQFISKNYEIFWKAKKY